MLAAERLQCIEEGEGPRPFLGQVGRDDGQGPFGIAQRPEAGGQGLHSLLDPEFGRKAVEEAGQLLQGEPGRRVVPCLVSVIDIEQVQFFAIYPYPGS